MIVNVWNWTYWKVHVAVYLKSQETQVVYWIHVVEQVEHMNRTFDNFQMYHIFFVGYSFILILDQFLLFL